MRRTLFLVPLLGALAVVTLFILKPAPSPAGPEKPTSPSTAAAVKLPITQAILYSSGVGFFQREGLVDGTTRIDLTFPVQDINDLLKSMVLQDLGGGVISAVSYDSQAPIEKTLRSFAINLTENPGMAQILGQARGERVEVILQPAQAAQAGTLTGTLVSVEKQRQPVGKDQVVDVELVNLWSTEGLRSIKLSEVQRLHFLNPVLDNEFKRALETLAQSHDTQKKAVSLLFNGQGKREVQVGYVVENPVWKTSYRLVLSGKKENKPAFQGWAVVDNAGEEDWKDVRMALVSGRPISFRMDLYQPLYVPRPLVEPELFASLRPPTYAGAMEGQARQAAGKGAAPGRGGYDRLAEGRKNVEELSESDRDEASKSARDLRQALQRDLQLGRGVRSAATVSELGDFFQYIIEHPVTLPRQKSALLPIVQKDVEAERVSIYNESTQAKHPLLGLKFKNTTGMHLMQGPITVFEGSSYAGDARVLDLQPNEERLLSYAIDLGTEVNPVAKHEPDRLIKVKINKGILYRTDKVRETKTYTIKNRSTHERTVLIEHPIRADFHLVGKVQPVEKARDVYRFRVKVPPGQGASEEIVEEKDTVSQVVLTNIDDQMMVLYLREPTVSEAVKKALTKAMELNGKWAATQRDIQQQERQLRSIVEDQGRLRANLKDMPPTAEAYKRYLKKFDDQETQIEQYQQRIKSLQETEAQQRTAYDTFLAQLNVE
jgi:hypothetical protein